MALYYLCISMINSFKELVACRDTPADPHGPAQLIDNSSCTEHDQVHVSHCQLLTRLDFMTVVADAMLRRDSKEFKMKGTTCSATALQSLSICYKYCSCVAVVRACQIFRQEQLDSFFFTIVNNETFTASAI